MSRRARLIVAAIAVLAAVAVGAWALSTSLGRPPSIEVGRSPLLDKPAPDFALPALDGSASIRLADYRGRPVIVNFWASWCIPCREEFPLLVAARARHATAGLEIVGIVHDDGPNAAQAFAADLGATWPLATDPTGSAWRDYLGVLLPITYYVDRDGIVRAVSYGPPPSGTLEEQIAKVL